MMIVGRRRGGMTVAELHAYMTDVHGAMVVRYITEQPSQAPQRYAQNHVVDSALRVPSATPDPLSLNRDFVTQVWFESPAQAGASLVTPFYLEQLRPDEDRFVDQASVVRLPVVERERRDGGTLDAGSRANAFKLFLFLKQQKAAPGRSAARGDFMAACDALSQALLADPAAAIGRWVCNEVVQRPGDEAAADLVEELWLASEADARRVGAQLMALAGTTLAGLVDPSSTCLLLAREHVLFAGPT